MLAGITRAMLLWSGNPPGTQPEEVPDMSSSEHNKTVVRECYVAGANGDRSALDRILDPEFVIHAPEDYHGVDGLLAMIAPVKSGIPDLTVTIDAQFADGDYVTTRFTARGTHDGALFGTPPTGREVAISGITVSRCANGKIAEEWELVDALGALQQVGALAAGAEA
jgi:predicted ester cyclase